MKLFYLLILFISSTNAYSNCSRFEYAPIEYKYTNVILLENSEFCTIYSLDKKIPLLSYSKIDRHSYQDRVDSFKEDKRIDEKYRTTLKDFYKSGYDRGHLFPSADSTNRVSMSETFYLTNIAPQVQQFNRISWRILEEDIRKNPASKYVYTGTIFGKKYIGNQVNMPDYFYKVIIYNNCYFAYIGKNDKVGTIKRLTLKRLYKLNTMDFGIKLKECKNEF